MTRIKTVAATMESESASSLSVGEENLLMNMKSNRTSASEKAKKEKEGKVRKAIKDMVKSNIGQKKAAKKHNVTERNIKT